jgi:molybdopterin/thiamine biosynthesis adenylyltransferase
MNKLANSHILIAGLNRLGVEIAKNAILAGIESVSIVDDTICTMKDLCSNFYIQQTDIVNKRSRAQACLAKLQSLNPYVTVKLIEQEQETENGSDFDLVSFMTQMSDPDFTLLICVDYALEEQIILNQICHQKQIHFISTQISGLFAQLFVDFGDGFEITDVNGERPKQGMIAHISKVLIMHISFHFLFNFCFRFFVRIGFAF